MTTTLSYAKYGDTIVSLVTYLGAHEFPADSDTATAAELADRLAGLLEKNCLPGFLASRV